MKLIQLSLLMFALVYSSIICAQDTAVPRAQVELQLARAQIAHNNQQMGRSLTLLNQALQLDPLFQEAFDLKIQILEQNKQYNEVVKTYQARIQAQLQKENKTNLMSPSAEILELSFALGLSYLRIVQDSHYPPFYQNAARAKAMQILQMCVRHHHQASNAHMYLGQLYFTKAQYVQALVEFEQGLIIVKEDKVQWKEQSGPLANLLGIELYLRYYIGLSLLAMAHADQAYPYLNYVVQESAGNPELRGLRNQALEVLRPLIDHRVFGSLYLGTGYFTNAAGLGQQSQRSGNSSYTKTINEEGKAFLFYESKKTSSLNFSLGMGATQNDYVKNSAKAYSTQTLDPFVALKINTMHGDVFSLPFYHSVIRTKQKDGRGAYHWNQFVTNDVFSPSWGRLNRLGELSFRMPVIVTSYQSPGKSNDRRIGMGVTQNFFPITSFFDPTLDLNLSKDKRGYDGNTGQSARLSIDNHFFRLPFLFRQTAYYQRTQMLNSKGQETFWGFGADVSIHLKDLLGHRDFWSHFPRNLFLQIAGQLDREYYNTQVQQDVSKEVIRIGLEYYL